MAFGILTFLKSGFLFCYEYSATITVLYTLYCPCAKSLIGHCASGEAQPFPSTRSPLLQGTPNLVHPYGTHQHKFKIPALSQRQESHSVFQCPTQYLYLPRQTKQTTWISINPCWFSSCLVTRCRLAHPRT